MWEAFNNLSEREQTIVIGGGVALLLLGLYFGAVEPLADRQALAQQNYARQLDTLRYLDSVALQLNASPAKGHGPRKPLNESLLAVINRTARAAHVDGAIRRISPTGNTAASLTLADVSFDHLIGWLVSLRENLDVDVIQVSITAGPRTGLVNATLSLAVR
jgi:general secretion pathway protein M